MKKMMVEITDDVAPQLAPYQDRLQELMLIGLHQIKAQEALALYERGLVSFARTAELAGLSRTDMVRQARALGIKPRWSEQMAQEELA
jgi:predicted HTH domain antitoxin